MFSVLWKRNLPASGPALPKPIAASTGPTTRPGTNSSRTERAWKALILGLFLRCSLAFCGTSSHLSSWSPTTRWPTDRCIASNASLAASILLVEFERLLFSLDSRIKLYLGLVRAVPSRPAHVCNYVRDLIGSSRHRSGGPGPTLEREMEVYRRKHSSKSTLVSVFMSVSMAYALFLI